MRPSSLAVVIGVLLVLPLAAQMRESIDVQVMELEATVLDRSGRPVEGLTQKDFQVRIGKRDVPITNFFAVRDGMILADPRTSPNVPAPESVSPETSIPTSLVIFIDEVHLSPASRKRSIEALKRYVAEHIGANTTATLIRYYKHFDVRLRPTERAGYILKELETIERQPVADDQRRQRERMIELIDAILDPDAAKGGRSASDVAGESPDTIFYRLIEYAERQTAEVDRTLAALEEAIRLASSFTGRRVLLYVSDGLPQTPALELFEYFDKAQRTGGGHVWRMETVRTDISQAMRFDRSRGFARVAETAQRADVAVYAFDAGGVRGYEGRGVESFSTLANIDTMSMQSNLRAGLQHVAEETGGMYMANENNIDKVLARMSEQFSSYYSIGVQPRRGEIRITVKNRPELRVVATRRLPPRTREDKLQQSVRSRLYTRAIENPLDATLHVGSASRVNDQCVVPVRLAVPQPKLPPELTPHTVEVRMVMLNEQNDETPVQQIVVPFESGRVLHSMNLRVRPERHVLSLAVSNPVSGESSFLQGEIDATGCR